MLPAVLIAVFTLFFLFAVSVMIARRDDLHALAYSMLFLYTIFSQIAYAYYPESSANLGAYFGPELFYDYWLFMFLSFVASFLGYLLFNPARRSVAFYDVVAKQGNAGTAVFYLSALMLIGILGGTFLPNPAMVRYGAEELSLGNNWFALGFRFLSLVVIILYVYVRSHAHSLPHTVASLFIFTVGLALFLQIAITAGSRGDLLYFMIGIIMFEVHPFFETLRKHKRKLLAITLAAIVAGYGLFVLEYVRYRFNPITMTTIAESLNQIDSVLGTSDVVQSLLLRDYFAPSHSLFVAMEYGMLGPIEVLKSNLANLLVGLRYPTLSEMIAGNVSRDIGRGYGWSFHLFVEGYSAVGWLGVVYNGLIWNMGLLAWNNLASSNNVKLNRAIVALLAVLITNMMRSQSAAFIKYIWLFIIPALGLLFLAFGVRPSIGRWRYNIHETIDHERSELLHK